MTRAVAGVLVAFGMGASFGYWLAPTPEARSRAPRSGVSTAPGTERPAVRETAAAPAPTGDGAIRGRVLDEHGAPIGNALVVVVPRSPRRGERAREAGAVPWQEVHLRNSVEALRWYERTRRTARTDAEGRYELTGLGAVPHGLRAYREGYKLRRTPGQPRGDVTPDATIDFAGQRLVLLGVEVLMPDGQQVGNVWLRARGPESSRNGTWSAASPWLEVRPGTYELQAKAGSRLEYISEKRTVRIEADRKPEQVVLQLAGERGLRVQVKLPEGFTARQLSLQYLRFEGTDPPGPAALRQSSQSAVSHHNQEFWIPGLATGRYLVGVHHGSFLFTATAAAEVGNGITDVLLDVPRPDPARFVAVRALRPDGRLEPHASVNFEIRTEGTSVNGGGVTLRGPDGTMYCAYPTWDPTRDGEMPAGARYFATVGARDLGRRRVEFQRKPGAAIEVRFAEPATLHVAIRDYVTSEHKETLRVTLYHQGTRAVAWWQALTPEGTYEFGPLQPGTYRVVLVKTEGKHSRWPIALHDVDVVAGKNELPVSIPRLYTLVVEIATPKPGLSVALTGKEIERFSVYRGVPADGIVRFPSIAAGAYQLYYLGKQHAVTVPRRGRFRIR